MNRIVKNAGWIIGCKVVKAVLVLIVTMITARYLGVANYGLINYAAGIVAFVAPIMKLGLDGIAVHEIVNHPDKEGETVGSIIVLCFSSSLLCVLGIFCFSLVANSDEPITISVCVIYGFVLLFQAIEMIQYWFQAKLLSKYSAIAMLISYVVVTIVQTLLLLNHVDLRWFALSYSIDFSVIAIVLLMAYVRISTQKLSFSINRSKAMLRISKYYIISGLMTTVFNNTDRIMLKLMVGDASTGIYAAAHTCAGMMTFVFIAIIDSMRSTIFESKKISNDLFEKRIKELYSIVIYFSLFVCIFVTIFSPNIIRVMYGSAYEESANVLRIAIWFTTFSYMGTTRDIWMLSEGKQKYIWRISLYGALMNIVLNYGLIPIWGSIGAAIASVISQIFINIIIGFLIKDLTRSNYLMIAGFKFSTLKGIISKLVGMSIPVQ